MTYHDIPYGKENAISKEELCNLWGVNERTARNFIAGCRKDEQLANRGEMIISSSHHRGFYRTKDVKEMKDFLLEMENRAKNCFMAIKTTRKIIRKAEENLTPNLVE